MINVPKAQVGLGTTGIGDNFARQRLMMAQKAGYVQSTPSPYAQAGTSLKQYQTMTPMLHQIAQAQGAGGPNMALRKGIMNPMPQQNVTSAANYNSTIAQRAQQLPIPHIPMNGIMNQEHTPVVGGPYVPPESLPTDVPGGGYPGAPIHPDELEPISIFGSPKSPGSQAYPPGTISNNTRHAKPPVGYPGLPGSGGAKPSPGGILPFLLLMNALQHGR